MHQKIENTEFWHETDLLTRVGSRLYGCANPDSDDDRRGFVVEPAEYLLGREKFEQHEDKVTDLVIWGVQKFFHGLTKGSPNVFEILFVPDEFIISATDRGREVLRRRDVFVCMGSVIPIRGFAHSEWLKAQLKTKNKETGEVYHSKRVVGAKRKASHAEHGYSVKNAYHAIRLLHQGLELVQEGHITFPRPEADFLRNIRNGEVQFEQLELEYEQLDARLSELIEQAPLRRFPDRKAIDELYYDITGDVIVDFLAGRHANTVS